MAGIYERRYREDKKAVKDSVDDMLESKKEGDMLKIKDYKGVKVESDNFAPFAQKGQVVLFSEKESIKNGDFVYVCFETGKGEYEWSFRKLVKIPGRKGISLYPTGAFDKTSVITGAVGSSKIPLCYRITGVVTSYN